MNHTNSPLHWVEKYKPVAFSDLSINTCKITIIKNWLEQWNSPSTYPSANMIISGPHGIGKKTAINIICNELQYEIKMLTNHDSKNKHTITEIIDSCNANINVYYKLNNNPSQPPNKFVLIIDNIDNISLSNEKESILDICKRNHDLRIIPIIFIANDQYNKLVSEMKKRCINIILHIPTHSDLLLLVKQISTSENIIFENDLIIDSIIKYSQYDIKQLIIILQDIYYTFIKTNSNSVVISIQSFNNFILNSHKKDIDSGLYASAKIILNNYTSIISHNTLYEINKVLLPLMIHQNYYQALFSKHPQFYDTNDNQKLLKMLNVSRQICDSSSKGDVIETNIYTNQNWVHQRVHGFYTICNNSFILNKLYEPSNKTFKKNYDYTIEFSADLHKHNLKSINKKTNILLIQQLIPNKNLDDLLYINKIIYYLLSVENFPTLLSLCLHYNISKKNLEMILKMDKTTPKLILSIKYKKFFSLLSKN